MRLLAPLSHLSLASLTVSHPSPGAVSTLAACDTDLPTWTIANLSVAYGAEVSTGGRASWTFSDSTTGKSDKLTCSLRANSRCEVVGTPSNPGVHIYLQISIDTTFWTVNSTWACESSP